MFTNYSRESKEATQLSVTVIVYMISFYIRGKVNSQKEIAYLNAKLGTTPVSSLGIIPDQIKLFILILIFLILIEMVKRAIYKSLT